MKKILITLAASAVAIAATADITAWNWKGGVVSPTLSAGTYADGALTFNNDLALAPSYTGTTIDIADIAGLIGTANLDVSPLVPFGGAYNSAQVDSDGIPVGNAWLVIDFNGGGIQVGDMIGLGGTGAINDLRPGGPGNPTGTPQTLDGGDITTGITVVGIPEPATLGLMGIAGLGMFLARKKARR